MVIHLFLSKAIPHPTQNTTTDLLLVKAGLLVVLATSLVRIQACEFLGTGC